MTSVNKVTVMGRFGKDPELKYTPSGVPVAMFNLATSETWTDKDGQKKTRTEWHRCVAWSKSAENIHKYCKKGNLIYVEGKLQTREWEDKDKAKRYTTEIIVSSFQLMPRAQENEQPPVPEDMPPKVNSGTQQEFNTSAQPEFTADDIPF